ncbi:MAG: cation:proton antiporter [Candidatus Limnocylindrales bacterium]
MNELVTTIGIILIASEIGGWAAHTVHIPRLVGQILAGIVLGPTVLGILLPDQTVVGLGELGAIAILGLAGLETNRRAIRSVGRVAFFTATGGVILPFIAGVALGLAVGLPAHAAAFTGAILTATSVGITARTLSELGIAGGRPAATILAAAVIDDILGLMVLAIIAGWAVPTVEPVLVLVPMVVTVLAAAVAMRYLPVHLDRGLDSLHLRGGGPAGAFGVVVIVACLVQSFGGLAGITGAYVAGLAFSDARLGPHVREHLERTVELIFAPAFFVSIGIAADLRAAGPILPFVLALIAVALLTKIVGCAVAARLAGMDGPEAGLVGVGMAARGEVALVAAALGLQVGAIDASLYAAVVVMAVVTTIATPIGMAAWYRLMARVEPAGRWALPAAADRFARRAGESLQGAAFQSAGVPAMSPIKVDIE